MIKIKVNNSVTEKFIDNANRVGGCAKNLEKMDYRKGKSIKELSLKI